MNFKKRGIATLLAMVILMGVFPAISASAATPPAPFLSTMYSDDNCIIDNSAKITSTESFGNGAVTLYGAQISSTGTRKENASKQQTFNMKIATAGNGGRLFVYSKPTADGLSYTPSTLPDIALQFEKDHPEWKVAVVTNASFFDNETKKTTDTGEPEDIYVEDGKTYKTYMEMGEVNRDKTADVPESKDVFKTGRGIIGLDKDANVTYYTMEKGTTHYNNSNTNSTLYSFESKHTLEVLGPSDNNVIYEYTLLKNAAFDYTSEPVFITSDMAARDFRGATVYDIACSQFRLSHVSVNGREIGEINRDKQTYYFEGKISKILSGTSSMQPESGHVYIATYQPLEHLQLGVTVRGNRKLSGAWADVQYAFGFKQQILLEGTSLFDNALQQEYGDPCYGDWNAGWTEDVYYASYGTNRTAVGFKADGTPVIITSQRNPNGTTGKDAAESGVTYYEMAWYMKELGCVNAFMLDCGGSMGMYKESDDTGAAYYANGFVPACHEPKHNYPMRAVANALILAYPSGKDANPVDAELPEADFIPGYITCTTATWYSGLTMLRKKYPVTNKSDFSLETNDDITKTNFSLKQNAATYIITPTTTSYPTYYDSENKTNVPYEAFYAYKKLGKTIQKGKKYTYCFKLHTVTKGKYTSFLFAELPDNTDSEKMLNNFAVVGGAFSNNGDSGYSDVRVGWGRVNWKDRDTDIEGVNQNIQLYLEEASSRKYSYHRLDIDGTSFTLKVKAVDGSWQQIGETYTLPEGSELILGCSSWENSTVRAMAVMDPVCVDITNLSNNINAAKALDAAQYTAESWAVLQAALTKADYSINLTYQTLINYANTNLANAINGLIKKEDVANDNIAEYEATSSSVYTVASWNAYTTAYNNLILAIESNDLDNLDALNEAYLSAKNALVAINVSVDVTWQDMSFTYVSVDKTWNPEEHRYTEDSSSGWVAEGSSNVIGVTNNSDVDLTIELDFTAEASFDFISGEFYHDDALIENNSIDVAQGSGEEISLKLGGAPPEGELCEVKGGTVTLTVTRLKE